MPKHHKDTKQTSWKNINCCRGKAGDVLYLEQADPFRRSDDPLDLCGCVDVYRLDDSMSIRVYLQVGPLLLDELLELGDVVYLPRGFPHVAGHFG